MNRSRRFWAAFLCTLLACLGLLWLSPYKDTTYSIPGRNISVTYYQDSAIWAELVHGLPGISRTIREADVLIMGSSRPLLGVSARLLNDRFKDQGLRFFNLGIGGGEGLVGLNVVVTQLDLRSKALLLNLDNDTLHYYLSPSMKEARGMDWFQAATRVVSVRLKVTVDTLLDEVGLPQLQLGKDGLALGPRAVMRGYRYADTGDWLSSRRREFPPRGPHQLLPAEPHAMLRTERLEYQYVKDILTSWKSRELHVVFFTIPYGNGPDASDYNPALAREAARRFGSDYIDLDWRLVRSLDNVHVDRESRVIVSEQLADQLAEPSRGFAERVIRLRSQSKQRR